MYSFKSKSGGREVEVTNELCTFNEFIEDFVAFALATGFQPETIKSYIDVNGELSPEDN